MWNVWNKCEASAWNQNQNQNQTYAALIKKQSTVEPFCHLVFVISMILLLFIWWQCPINVAGRQHGDLQRKEQPVPVTDNLEWETKAPCRAAELGELLINNDVCVACTQWTQVMLGGGRRHLDTHFLLVWSFFKKRNKINKLRSK